MEDLETLSKRRKLDESGGEHYGQNGKTASPIASENNVNEGNSCHKPRHREKVKLNFKELVRPEFLKCFENIVDGLKHTEATDKKESKSEDLSQPERGRMVSRMDIKGNASAPKRKLNREYARVTQDSSNGHSVKSPVRPQKYSPDRVIPSPLMEESVRDVIRKLIKDHTRGALHKAESLQSRVSALESENSWLKHRVKILFKALKEAISRQRQQKVIPTTFPTTSIQKDDPHVKPSNGGCLQARPANTQSAAAITNCVISTTATTYNSLGSISDEADTIRPRGTSPTSGVSSLPIRAPRNAASPWIPNNIINSHTTSSVGTTLHGPMISFSKEEALHSVKLPINLAMLSTNRGQNSPGRAALDNGMFSSVTAPSSNLVTVSSSGHTTESVTNTVPLVSRILNEIVPNTEMRDQFNRLSVLKVPKGAINFNEPLLCSDAGLKQVANNVSAQNGSKRVSPLLKQNVPTVMSNICNESTSQADVKRLMDQHNVEYLSPRKPNNEELIAETKHREVLKSTRTSKIPGVQEKTDSNNRSSQYKCFPGSLPCKSQECSTSGLYTVSSNTACQTPVSCSEFPSVLDNSISNSGQSVGLFDGVAIPAQASGPVNTTSYPKLNPVKSNSIYTPSPQRIGPNNDKNVQNPDLCHHSVKKDILSKDNKALHKVPYKLEVSSTKFQPHLLPGSVVSECKPHCYRPGHSQNAYNNKAIKGHCTTTILSPMNKHQDLSFVDKVVCQPPHKNIISAAFPSEERLFPFLEKNAIGQVTESFSNDNTTLSTGIFPNKVQTMLSFTKPDGFHNLLSSARFYNGRECIEHTRRPSQSSTSIPYPLPAKPRHLPYPIIKTNPVQRVPWMESSVRFDPKVTEKEAKEPHEMAQVPQSPNAEVRLARKQHSLPPKWQQIEKTQSSCREFISDPARRSCSPETWSSKAEVTDHCVTKAKTSSRYNKERLLPELLQSNRTSFIPQHASMTSNNESSPVKQDFSSAQSINAVLPSSQNPQISKKYVHLQPRSHAQESMIKPKIPSVFDSDKAQTEGLALPGKTSSAGESDKNGSWQTKCTIRPQIELSNSCQRYLNQLKKSPEVPTSGHQNSIYSIAKLTPHSGNDTINLEDGFHGLQFQIPSSSMKRQTTCQQLESCNDKQMNLKALTTQSKKENESHKQHRPLYHHKKIINP